MKPDFFLSRGGALEMNIYRIMIITGSSLDQSICYMSPYSDITKQDLSSVKDLRVILHTDAQTRVILILNYIFLNLNDFNLHVTYRYKVTIN